MPEGAPSLSEASAAMSAALSEANAEAPVAVEATPVAVEATPNEGTPAVETPAETFSLDGVDLSGLSPDDLAKVKSAVLRQQDYTKKTQEVAPYRKFMEESNADLDKVRQSYDFVSRLENDKEFLKQVAQELSELANDPDNSEQPNAPLEAPSSDPALVRTVNEFAEWKAQVEAKEANDILVRDWQTKLSTAEKAIRESNPTYTDDDITAIYDNLAAHDFDMFATQEWMEAHNNRIINAMVKPKLNHPGAANPVNAGTLTTSPKEVRTFEEAAAITRERLRQSA